MLTVATTALPGLHPRCPDCLCIRSSSFFFFPVADNARSAAKLWHELSREDTFAYLRLGGCTNMATTRTDLSPPSLGVSHTHECPQVMSSLLQSFYLS